MSKITYIFLGFGLLLLIIFKYWFTPTLLAGGDMVTYSPVMVKDVSMLSSWDDRGSGMGNSKLITFPLETYFTTTMKLTQGLDWRVYERIFWLFPILIFSTTSSFFLVKKFVHRTSFAILGSFLYTLNTYALMLIGGGQNGVVLSYSVLPFLLLTFFRVLENPTFYGSLFLTLSFNIVLFFDLRVMYIGLVMLTILTSMNILFIFRKEHITKRIVYLIVLPALLTIGLQSFWLLPFLAGKGSAVSQFGKIYTGSGAVKFFSFAFFENSLGLLHPNWPENIFGKVGFMRPEFLLLPLLAFSSLLFVHVKKQKESFFILLFALLGLIGVFLAKGAHDPFGGLYLWLFDHVPGFIMFRDPTKWYTVIAISYSVLIPYSIEKIYEYIQLQFQRYSTKIPLGNIFVILVLCGLLFTIRQAFLGQIGGTLKPHVVSQEYKQVEKYIESQKTFSRSLWVPMVQRFGSYTNNHPAISAQDYYNVSSISGVVTFLNKKDALQQLQDASIQYVIVPDDTEKEVFLKDRAYSEQVYLQTFKEVKNISWLTEIPGFGRVHVFSVPGAKDHFWLGGRGSVVYHSYSPTKYLVTVKDVEKGETLVFSEAYDANWLTPFAQSQPYNHTLNSFVLQKSGVYTFLVDYKPQRFVFLGMVISGVTGVGIIGILIWLKARKMLK